MLVNLSVLKTGLVTYLHFTHATCICIHTCKHYTNSGGGRGSLRHHHGDPGSQERGECNELTLLRAIAFPGALVPKTKHCQVNYTLSYIYSPKLVNTVDSRSTIVHHCSQYGHTYHRGHWRRFSNLWRAEFVCCQLLAAMLLAPSNFVFPASITCISRDTNQGCHATPLIRYSSRMRS